MDIINEYLSKFYEEEYGGMRDFSGNPFIKVRPRIECKDGFSISVQAASHCYCTPRGTFRPTEKRVYEEVELGYPSKEDELINDYAEDPDYTDTVYPYTPIDIVVKLIEKHGGIK